MNSKCFSLAAKRVGETYARQAEEARRGREARLAQLLEQGKLPQVGMMIKGSIGDMVVMSRLGGAIQR